MREMKDSGIEWIGKIPETWLISQLKRNCKLITGNTPNTKISIWFDGDINWFTPSDFTDSYLLIESKRKLSQKAVDHGVITLFPADINLLVGIGATAGKVGYCTKRAYGNQQVTAICNNCNLLAKYITYYLVIAGHVMFETSMFTTLPILNNSTIGKFPLLMPPLAEQQAIADFLDAKCADIDSLTADIQKQINILKEYKKSVITQAVTKGLDPNVEMKDSGVGWIGMIPSKWNIGKIKSYVDKVGSGKTPKGDNTLYTKGKILFLRSQNVYNTGIILDDPPTVITDAIDKELSNTRVITDDVLLNITGGSIGRCCIYNLEKKANVNQHVSIIRMKKDKMLSGYMHYFWISDLGQTAINLYQTGGNREGMSASAIKNTPIPFMSIWEQQAIIDFLDSKCADIDAIISGKQKQLDVLKEYKKSLIYEYVTGKKEVPCHE